MTSRIQFIPAAAETLTVAGGNTPQGFSLPAVDGSNTDLTVSHSNVTPIYVSFGAGAVAGPSGFGNISVPANNAILLTSNAAVLAAATNALVQGGGQAAAAGSGTPVSVWSQGGCTVTFTRGTASAVQTF